MLMNLISIMLHAHYCVCVYITVCVGGMYTQSLSDVVYIRFHSLCMCNYTHLYIHGACMYVCMYIVPIRLSVFIISTKGSRYTTRQLTIRYNYSSQCDIS